MNNSAIQMKLLSEVRTRAQVLNFALSRERGQENQRKYYAPQLQTENNQVSAVSINTGRNNVRQQQETTQPTCTNKELCWRYGGFFIPGHINQCTAKQALSRVASLRTQCILRRCVGPKYLPYHPDKTSNGVHTNVPRDRDKANSKSDKYKKNDDRGRTKRTNKN